MPTSSSFRKILHRVRGGNITGVLKNVSVSCIISVFFLFVKFVGAFGLREMYVREMFLFPHVC